MTAVCPPGLERVPGFGEQHYQAGRANCSGSCLFVTQYGFSASATDLQHNDNLGAVFFFFFPVQVVVCLSAAFWGY